MRTKVLLALVAAALVAGLPEPDPNTDVDVEVDSGDSKVDSYFSVVKTAGQTTFKLISKLLGQADGGKCCEIEVAFSYPKRYIKYENGATDVPCSCTLAGKNGTCVDGNVVCESEIMGVASSEITLNVDNEKTNINKSIQLYLVPGSSIFDAMNIAKQDNELSFTYTCFQGGAMIQDIDGVENNIAEGATWGWVWTLLYCIPSWPTVCTSSPKGVSETYPNNDAIWTWRYNCQNWTDWNQTEKCVFT